MNAISLNYNEIIRELTRALEYKDGPAIHKALKALGCNMSNETFNTYFHNNHSLPYRKFATALVWIKFSKWNLLENYLPNFGSLYSKRAIGDLTHRMIEVYKRDPQNEKVHQVMMSLFAKYQKVASPEESETLFRDISLAIIFPSAEETAAKASGAGGSGRG